MQKNLKLSSVLQRELKGKVLSRVAKEVGLSVSLLHDWHSSSRAPSAKNMWQLRNLAAYLGLTLEEILFDDNSGKELVSSSTFKDKNGIQYRVNVEMIIKKK